jgi:hypothetical protein
MGRLLELPTMKQQCGRKSGFSMGSVEKPTEMVGLSDG